MSTNQKMQEWFADTIWGKVAMVSFGDPRLPPVLMLHGFLDNVATFFPLLELLPDTHYYVGFDKPGHGKSEHYPVGPLATQMTYIEVINAVVRHMKWNKFIVLAHSLGFLDALFYHSVYPGRISSMVALDALPPVTNYYFLQHEPDFWFTFHYTSYYDDFKKNFEEFPLLTREQAVQLVVRRRKIPQDKAEVVLSRMLKHEHGDLYRLTIQPMVKKLTQFPVQLDMLESVITTNPPPMLNLISATRSDTLGRKYSAKIMEELHKNGTTEFILIDGGHDVHLENPHLLVPYIVEFLSTKSNKAKL